jgi:energy-coupling factor transporter ATP-binding protein EcfA2
MKNIGEYEAYAELLGEKRRLFRKLTRRLLHLYRNLASHLLNELPFALQGEEKDSTVPFLIKNLFRMKSSSIFDGKGVSEAWYEILGEGFSEGSRDDQLSRFQSLLSSASGTIYIRSSDVFVEFDGETFSTRDTRFFSTSPLYFDSVPVRNPLKARPKITERRVGCIKTEIGFAKVFVAHRFPSFLPEGFLYSTFSAAEEICIKWKLLDSGKFVARAERTIARKSGRGVLESGIAEDLAELIQQLRIGSDAISFHVFFVLFAETEEELKNKSKELKSTLKLYGVEIDSPPFYQHELYEFRTKIGFFFKLKDSITSTESARAFYPFIKENLAEYGGVFLGFSGTGDPVVFDPYRRQNYLMLILGETGSGKSMTAKAYLSRLHSKKKLPVFGIDPENEYSKIAYRFGSQSLELSDDRKLGLDPLLLGIDRILIADLLSEIYSVPREFQPRLRKELYGFEGDIPSFAENCSPEIRRYLEPATVPPDSNVFQGKPMNAEIPVVFGLKSLKSIHAKLLAATLISAFLSQNLNRPSVLFVDEGWLFIKVPKLMAVFENAARRGRKYGLHFIFITQRVEDVASTQEGRTLLEQAATALLFRQEKEGIELIKDIYKLSPGDVKLLTEAMPGEGIMKASNVKIGIRIALTKRELKEFSTTPKIS